MAADVALLGPCPGGASPGLKAVRERARAGLETEAAGAELKGLPSTAARRALPLRLGLNLIGGTDGSARRASRTLTARATAIDAVPPSICIPDLAKTISTVPSCRGGREFHETHAPGRGPSRVQIPGRPGPQRRRSVAAEGAPSPVRGRRRTNDPVRTGQGLPSLQIVAGLWQGRAETPPERARRGAGFKAGGVFAAGPAARSAGRMVPGSSPLISPALERVLTAWPQRHRGCGSRLGPPR